MLHLREISADDVMVPRADIVAMRLDVSYEQAIAQIREEGHSRLPVYREQLDEVVGMVHIKDVFSYAGKPETFSLEPLLRRPLMIAPQIPVLDLLLQMRQSRMHLALVVDEYGGIDGLLTIEDLVETIVGDISDEHDEVVGPMVTERPDGSLDVNARLPVEAFEQRLGPVLTEHERESDIDTVGGLVFRLAGRVPARGEVVSHSSWLGIPRAGRRSAPHPPRARPPPAAAAVGTGHGGSRRLMWTVSPGRTRTARPGSPGGLDRGSPRPASTPRLLRGRGRRAASCCPRRSGPARERSFGGRRAPPPALSARPPPMPDPARRA